MPGQRHLAAPGVAFYTSVWGNLPRPRPPRARGGPRVGMRRAL